MEPLEQPSEFTNEKFVAEGQRLGRLPLKTTRKALNFNEFFSFIDVPTHTKYWLGKSPVPLRTFGNDRYGNCTRAKQAYAIMRMERIEQKRSPKITDEEVIRVYEDMSNRLYGGGDNGAYEDDALNEWRRPETTIRDVSGHAYTIDAYLRINAMSHKEVRTALALSGAKGIAVCFNLPAAFIGKAEWDIPEGQPLVGPWMPGTWGGHSMWMLMDHDEVKCFTDDTWMRGPSVVTWRAMAAYMDEAHMVIDSVDGWRKKSAEIGITFGKEEKSVQKSLAMVIEAVNDVSSYKIERA